jgi:hypothetical protein
MPALRPRRADDVKHLCTFLGVELRVLGSLPRSAWSRRGFFVEWRSIFVLHFACKLLPFHCDELRCFVLKSLISK